MSKRERLVVLPSVKPKPILKLKDPKRFLRQKEQQQKIRDSEDWTTSKLIDEVYLSLMSVKEKDEEGVRRRKYEEQIRKKMYWMPIPPHSSVVLVSLKDLDTKVKQELLKRDAISRGFTLKEAVGMICEQVDREFYLLSAKQFLKVKLEE
jgi:hypothetical protein